MRYQDTLTAQRLRELLSYDPETGQFTRLVSVSHGKRGSIAGGVKETGYVAIRIDGIKYRAHRLAWLYMTGAWPAEEIDHINRRRNDNRWVNLRPATRQGQCGNSVGRGKSGIKGVTWSRPHKKWRAEIAATCLGYFDCKHEAGAVYARAAIDRYGTFACLDHKNSSR